jgi:hypothetical protein
MSGSWLTCLHPRQALGLDRASRAGGSGAARRGTSLLEVMFAMGVAIIGLLGVAALIPVAAQRMGRGIQADQVAAYGRAVVAEFDIRGMGQRRNFTWNPGTGNFTRFQEPGAFCFDPLVVSALPAINTFPSTGAAFTIPRVTLQRFSNIADPVVRATVVDGLFRFDDDLIFQRPLDRTLPPFQLYSSAPVPVDPIKRQYMGRFTWMATLSPSRVASQSDLYTLSVVIFDGRDPDPTNEIVMPVTATGTGLGGGDVEFGAPLSGHNLVDVDIRPDDWVMLSTQTTPRYVRWYRVASADREVVNGTKYAFLMGANWDVTVGTQATLIKGVVGVFEKTFRLEDTSLWKIK